MGTKDGLYKVDPLCLSLGMTVGPWRITGWGGRGAYGTLYRVEHESRKVAGPFALKLAISPRDERFEREARLLSRIRSPHVPGLEDQGLWKLASGAYPYLVMEWIDGEPLYTWAERRNPTSRQVLELLGQLARALEATHAAEGVHRDVKGDNVLVRPSDGSAFLTDFGAGNFRGAGTLTSKLLPPGTAAYRSPEARAFVEVFSRHPTAHYPASACDDLFALGVLAYRLVTDEYPRTTSPQEPGELNAKVSPELNASILRLLAVAPDERFEGVAQKAAEALEHGARSADSRADQPLFSWGHEPLPRWRAPSDARLAAEQDGAAKLSQAVPLRKRSRRYASSVAWAMAVSLGLILNADLREPVRQTAPSGALQTVAVGDGAKRTPKVSPSVEPKAVGREWPEKLLPDQRQPPCRPRIETLIKGACWIFVGDMSPPCGPDAFDRDGKCYIPAPAPAPVRQPTSASPK